MLQRLHPYEEVAEFDYQPTACKKAYRMIVVRKNIAKEQGGVWLLDLYRYFFTSRMIGPARLRK